MKRTRWLPVTLAALVAAAPAAGAERLVDYGADETSLAATAAEQGIALAPLPARGVLHVALSIGPDVDHAVTGVGIACSGLKVRNPVSVLLKRMFAAWDRDGAALPATDQQGADLLVRIDRAATLSRCISTGEYKWNCITRVSIDASVTPGGGAARPLHVEREVTEKSGICSSARQAPAIGLVSRAAVGDLLGQLAAFATPPPTPG